MKDLTLVVMAAGMGSRFGGLKQIEPLGMNGEIIADYSVYDAIRTGFKKVVFIIRKEHLEYFKEHITKNFEDKIEVDFAFQELDMIPADVTIPSTREKMLGTGHAVLCAKDKIDGDFVIINGDDFYGLDAYKRIVDYFNNHSNEDEYVTVNYPISKTMSKNGAVKRGVVKTSNGYVTETIESEIRDEDGKLIAKPLNGSPEFTITPEQGVSMNFFGFHKKFLELLEEEFNIFIHGEITDKNEFLMPEVLAKLIKKGEIKGVELVTDARWMGVTYREDVKEFKEEIAKLVENNAYPEKLWR